MSNMISPSPESPYSSSDDFFTVRIWAEDQGDEGVIWRGTIKHISTGEVFYFQGWQDLVEKIQLMLSGGEFK